MSKALLVGFLGIWLAGCYSTQDHTGSYREALHRQATVTNVAIETKPSEGRAQPPPAKVPSQDLGVPQPTQSLVVTTGSLSQSYEALGEVRANTTDVLLSTADLRDALFRSRLSVTVQGKSLKLSYPQMDERLRTKAQAQYGTRVNAVINVTYRTDPDGDVYAFGLAVHFTEPQPTPLAAPVPIGKILEGRLKELRRLREQNLITPEEYDDKRSELLEEF